MPLLSTFAGASARAFGMFGGTLRGFDLIQVQTLGASAANVTFSAIPQTYRHLQLRWMARDDNATATDMGIQVNADATTSYRRHYLLGTGGTTPSITSSSQTAQTSFGGSAVANSGNYANFFGVGIADLLDYTLTGKYKTLRMVAGTCGTGNTDKVVVAGGLWVGTAAITSLTLLTAGANLVAGTVVALYGVI